MGIEWLEIGRSISAIMVTAALVYLFVAATEPPPLLTVIILTTLISILLGIATLAEHLGWAGTARQPEQPTPHQPSPQNGPHHGPYRGPNQQPTDTDHERVDPKYVEELLKTLYKNSEAKDEKEKEHE